MMHKHSVHSLAISDDSELLASGDARGVIKIWKIRSGKCLKKFKKAHSTSISSLKFSSDGMKIITSSDKIFVFGL